MSVLDTRPPLVSASVERAFEELTILYEVSCALQKTLDEERALYTILVGVTSGRGLGFNRAFILLEDSDAGLLCGRLAIGPSSPEEASRIWRELREKNQTLRELLDSITESPIKKDLKVNEIVSRFRIPLANRSHPLLQIMHSRQACRCENGVFQPLECAADQETLQLLGTGNFAVAPLFLAGKDFGLLIADNGITGAPVELSSLRLLQIYAQQAGAAVQNIWLYNDLTQQIAACENTNLTLRETQSFRLQAERLSTIGRMTAILAHEIRTPLASIGGFARRLLRTLSGDDPRREEMEIIVGEVARLERLIEEVLGCSRVVQTEYRPTDINGLIRSLISMMHEEIEKHSVNTVLQLNLEMPLIRADESQIRQALMNLIMNALDAMPSGGTLTIATSFAPPFIEIAVGDTGGGIAQEHCGKLFDAFFTTKAEGTGLGLTIVQQVVDNHNGSLRFDSVPEGGTTFFLRFAVDPEQQIPRTTSPPVEQEIPS